MLLFLACSDNLQLLRQRYYYATWKADGTRYMMLIMRDGCFLIDRNFCFRRVQMRFPHRNLNEVTFFFWCWRNHCSVFLFYLWCWRNHCSAFIFYKLTLFPCQLKGPHAMTLIDGEMIIDTVPDSGLRRRYLAYDLMALDSVYKTKVYTIHPSLFYYVEAEFFVYYLMLCVAAAIYRGNLS